MIFLRLLCVDNLSVKRWRLEDEAPRLRWVHLVKATTVVTGCKLLGKLSPEMPWANWDFLSRNFCLNGKRDKSSYKPSSLIQTFRFDD